MLIDTHCHIHERDYPLDADEVIQRAHQADVMQMICVGTDEKSSEDAIVFASGHKGVFAAIGVHPHETKEGWGKIEELAGTGLTAADLAQQVSPRQDRPRANSLEASELAGAQTFSPRQESPRGPSGMLDDVVPRSAAVRPSSVERKLVAIGEIGLDYFYNHSPRDIQIQALESQIQTALDHNLPIIFHVREAFIDFWPIFDNFHGIRGVLHSFTDSQTNVDQALRRGLYIGVNGISTFTKDTLQQELFAQLPLDRLLLETDAPFLTPTPKRGTVNEPAFVSYVAQHHATIRGITTDDIARATTANASALFAL